MFFFVDIACVLELISSVAVSHCAFREEKLKKVIFFDDEEYSVVWDTHSLSTLVDTVGIFKYGKRI